MVDVHATAMTLWVVENRIAMKRSQGIGSIDKTSRRVLIRIDTDGGVCGYGEAAPWAVFSGTVECAVSGLARYFWPQVKGARVADIPKIIKACERAAVGHPEAKAAIEVALYDIVGKVWLWIIAGIAVGLGENHPRQRQGIIEGLGGVGGVLAGHAVHDKQGLHRSQGPVQPLDFIHHGGIDMQPPRGIDNQHIHELLTGSFHGRLGDGHRVLAGVAGMEVHPNLPGQGL